ncbi:MAG: TraM recognition domain-containing protein [bacterium]|nr:TraM recognition domain-containing protein [bacterium]
MLDLNLLLVTIFGLLFTLIFSIVTFYIWVLYTRNKNRLVSAKFQTVLLVRLPKDNEIELGAAEQLFSSFYSIKKSGFKSYFQPQDHISLEIVATEHNISFYVVVPNEWVALVEKQIHAAYPEAEIEVSKPWDIFTKSKFLKVTSLKLNSPDYYPVQVYENLTTDSMNLVTSSMSKLSEGEGLALQVLVKPAGDNWRVAGRNFIHSVREQNNNPEKANLKIDEGFLKGVEEKIKKVGFEVTIRIISSAQDELNAQVNLDNVANSFSQFTDPTYNTFSKATIFKRLNLVRDLIYRVFPASNIQIPKLALPIFKTSFVLNVAELATIYHFPSVEVKTPNINWIKSRTSPAPKDLPKEGLYLGKSEFRGETQKVFLSEDDRRRHMYVIGQTGTGKSELLKFMAMQDIKAGKGVAFIDPHGSAIADMLPLIPKERLEDVILFDPGDKERPLGLNILEAKTEDQKHLIINSFISLLYKLYDPNRTGIIGPRLERAVRNIMLTAMYEEGNTMVEVLKLLIDPEYAKSKIPLITDDLVRSYWTQELAQTSDFHKSETLGYFVSKFDRFVTEKTMRNIIGQGKSAIDFRKVMDEQKILLVDLSKGKIGEENSNFLGLILVPRILAAAMSRIDQAESERKDFYLYVDEFQNFSTPDFVQILSEARKYRLNLIVANQFIAQISDDIKNAVFGNVGTLASFRVGSDDSNYLEQFFQPNFNANDLLNNPVGQLYTKLLINGQPSDPFSLHTDWELISAQKNAGDPKVAEAVKQLSRLKYGRDRLLVEEEIRIRSRK